MERFVALFFSGLTDGSITALAAVGLLMLYKATSIINFAHGDLITLGAYFGVWLTADHGWPYGLAVIGVAALMFTVGAAVDAVTVAPLRGKSVHVVVIATLGLALAIRSLIGNWRGTQPERLESPLQSGSTEVLGAAVNHHRLMIVALAAALVVGIAVVFQRTRFGREVRAVAADRDMARLLGVRAGALSMGAFGLSAALAGVCGALIAPLTTTELTLGFAVMLNAFAAMIIGGFGSVIGVTIAAFVIGMLERVVGGYVFTEYSSALPFVFMIAAIAIRPEGLYGAREHASRL